MEKILRENSSTKFNLDISVFSSDKIIKILSKLDKSKSIGVDGIHPWVLINCREVIGRILSKIFTKSYISGLIPIKWKHANITPIPKRGNSNAD